MSEAADAALQRALAEACLGAGAGEAIAGDLRAWLEARGVAADDIEAILQAPRRLTVYRSLVRNGLSSVVLQMLPQTRARLNAASEGRFDADLAAFVDQVGPRTHHLRDVPAELVAWAAPRWAADPGVPGYIVDLARHELAHFMVAASAPAHRAPQLAEVALERPLAFVDSMRLLHHAWAVHELVDEAEETRKEAPLRGAVSTTPLEEPAHREVHLLAYRDSEHVVRWLELTPLAAAVLQRLASGDALGAAVEGACLEHGVAPGGVLPDMARLLADLGERGVLLGAR